MTRYALIGTLALLCAALGALWWQSGRIDTLSAENALLTRNAAVYRVQLAQAKETAAVVSAHFKRSEAIAVEANATIEAIRKLKLGECADAQIDPDLADLLGRGNVPAND